jgi:hypothetical protein
MSPRLTPAQALQEYANKLNELFFYDAEKCSRLIAIRQIEFNSNSDYSNQWLTTYVDLSSRFITQLNLLKSKLDATDPVPGTVHAILKAVGNLVYVEGLQEFESIHAYETFNDDRMILLELLHDTVLATSQYYSNPNSQEKFNNLQKATEAFSSMHNSILAPRNRQSQSALGKGFLVVLAVFLPILALGFLAAFAGASVTPMLTILFMLKAFAQVSGIMAGICEVATLSNLYASGDHFFNTAYRKNASRVSNSANVFFKAAEELREPQPVAENERGHAFN